MNNLVSLLAVLAVAGTAQDTAAGEKMDVHSVNDEHAKQMLDDVGDGMYARRADNPVKVMQSISVSSEGELHLQKSLARRKKHGKSSDYAVLPTAMITDVKDGGRSKKLMEERTKEERPAGCPIDACPMGWIGDDICDEGCNSDLCNYDNGDCTGYGSGSGSGYDNGGSTGSGSGSGSGSGNGGSTSRPTGCPVDACPYGWIGDDFCDQGCNTPLCNYDNGDCTGYGSGGNTSRPAGCPVDTCPIGWIADGFCDQGCNIDLCNYDNGDCAASGSGHLYDTLGSGFCGFIGHNDNSATIVNDREDWTISPCTLEKCKDLCNEDGDACKAINWNPELCHCARNKVTCSAADLQTSEPWMRSNTHYQKTLQ